MNKFFEIDSMIVKNTALGVECLLQEEDVFRFRLCELVEKKKKLEIKRCVEFNGNDTELKEYLKPESAINLVIQGRGIISKKVEANTEEEDASLLNKCLPGSNPDDFYIQRYSVEEGTIYVSIIRKNIVQQIVDFFTRHKVLVVNICLGPFVAEDIFSFLKLESFIEQKITLGNYELTVSSNKINQIRLVQPDSKEKYELSGIEVGTAYIYSFASAMGFYVKSLQKIVHPDLSTNELEYEELKTHQKLMRWILICVAVICIINFVVYKYYRNQFKDLYAQVQINQESLKNFDNMKMQFEEKKDVLDRNGLLEASRISYYSDKIAASLLEGINLVKLESFPMKKVSVEGQEDIVFQNEKIIVSGTCEQSIDFNSWERILKKMDWVKTVSILHYMQDRENELAKFTIEIVVRKKNS